MNWIKPCRINLSISSYYVIWWRQMLSYIYMLFYRGQVRMKPFNYSKKKTLLKAG
jgi:hypothetical protein